MRALPYLLSYKSLLILSAALGLCAACGVRGPLTLPNANPATAPAPAGGAVLVGADGKTVPIALPPSQADTPTR